MKKQVDQRRTIAHLQSYFPLDWSMQRRYRLPSDDADQPYYICYPGSGDPDASWKGIAFDPSGVVVACGVHNPAVIAQYALYSHERMLRGVPSSAEAFFTQIQWLINAQRPDGSYSYDFALPDYGIKREWISAMAQGLAASAFVRAHVLTGRACYRDAAVRACEPLKRDVSVGGATFISEGQVFFEEVADRQSCHVLNGHLFAAFGVWDLARLGLADPELCRLHERAIRTLQGWLPHFENGDWSYYQLAVRNRNKRYYASMAYHQLHIAQLHVYFAMTGIGQFERTAQRWEAGLQRAGVRARFLCNSVAWLYDVARQRVGIERRTPWTPMDLSVGIRRLNM